MPQSPHWASVQGLDIFSSLIILSWKGRAQSSADPWEQWSLNVHLMSSWGQKRSHFSICDSIKTLIVANYLIVISFQCCCHAKPWLQPQGGILMDGRDTLYITQIEGLALIELFDDRENLASTHYSQPFSESRISGSNRLIGLAILLNFEGHGSSAFLTLSVGNVPECFYSDPVGNQIIGCTSHDSWSIMVVSRNLTAFILRRNNGRDSPRVHR
jgi:hypothetical protein